jgi:citronellol/citronellal dehydrogenase
VFRAGLFDGQVVIVTGAGSGIGRCIAHELASLGALAVLTGRDESRLARVAEEIRAEGIAQRLLHAE